MLQDGVRGIYSRIGRIPEFVSTNRHWRLWLFNLLIPAKGAGGRLDCCLLTLSVCTSIHIIFYQLCASGPLPCKCKNEEECPLFPPFSAKHGFWERWGFTSHMSAISGKSLRDFGRFGSCALIMSSRLKQGTIFQGLYCIFC